MSSKIDIKNYSIKPVITRARVSFAIVTFKIRILRVESKGDVAPLNYFFIAL